MKAIRLRTEYLADPLGIDIQHPRLMWNCEEGLFQTAYQVRAYQKTDDSVSVLWDSGRTASGSMEAVYPLTAASRERVYWQVRLFDEADVPGEWSEEAFFEMGLLHPEDWKAKWIAGNYRPDRRRRYPVDIFHRAFRMEDIKKARLYITSCGLYEAVLNGKKVGNFVLAPGYTDYRKRIQYQTYDVTDLLTEGLNDLTVSLADGWYRGSIGAWGLRNQYGTQTKLLLQLEVTHSDGHRSTLVSGPSWKWTNEGPVRFADNKDGEIVDARKTVRFEKKTGHASVKKALTVSRHLPPVPTASNNVPVTEHERFTPALIRTPSGKQVLDFGQNIAGYAEFSLYARENDRIILRFGEMLDKSGEFTQDNIQCVRKDKRTPLQKVEYICKEGLNHYKTRFAIFGFRYAEVTVIPAEADPSGKGSAGPGSSDTGMTAIPIIPENFTAIAVYSDMEQTGFFKSSNELLNRFVDATLWSAKGNHADIPTDCPTRERHGWTGDAQIFFNTAAYLFDYAAFSKKYLRDLYDWQKKNGCLPQIAPYGGVDFYMAPMNGSVGWSDIGILLPWRFYQIYRDKKILETSYDNMARYARFMIFRCGRYGGPLASPVKGIPKELRKFVVNRGQSYGEWAEPADVHPNDWKDMAAPHPEVSTAYTAYVLGIMAGISELLRHEEDAALFRSYAEGCRKAYQALVRDSLDTDRQALLVRPLYMDLLDPEQTAYAKERLVKALDHYGWRLGTGFLSTPLILNVLTDINVEYAYRLLQNEQMPGWLFMPKNGATTIWESWEGTEAQGGIASLNHYSKGAAVEWLFSTMCGIRIEKERHFAIAPHPGGDFTFAEARYHSIFGWVSSGWTKEGLFRISIPANCTADVYLPDGKTLSIGPGEHEFTCSVSLA